MRVLVLGGDGYLGWPTAMRLSTLGHDICVVDNYYRRAIALETQSEPLITLPNLHGRAELFYRTFGKSIQVQVGDCADFNFLANVFQTFGPETVVHYAEQPSAPYSMIGFEQAKSTLLNNLSTTFNVIWAAIKFSRDCHIIKLGTMGEYGTPNIDIEEGWIEILHNGRKDRFLYPRQAGSLYHTTKILDTDLLWFYVRMYEMRVTDLMQGPVYGVSTEESKVAESLAPHFYYDDIFGTVVNRFVAQAVAGAPLTVYGAGGQTRGYLNVEDTLECIRLAVNTPAAKGELRILNQFTEQFTVSGLAEKVKSAAHTIGLSVSVSRIENPRKELEDHYYNAKHHGLTDLGLSPHLLTEQVMVQMLEHVMRHKDKIDMRKIMPRVKWAQ